MSGLPFFILSTPQQTMKINRAGGYQAPLAYEIRGPNAQIANSGLLGANNLGGSLECCPCGNYSSGNINPDRQQKVCYNF
jgi:hypothetical protein